MASLSIPATALPGENITVLGTGFDPRNKFALTTIDAAGVESGFDEATGFPSNINRPRKDGSFTVGIHVPPTLGNAFVRAYAVSKVAAGWKLGAQLAQAGLTVEQEAIPVDPKPAVVSQNAEIAQSSIQVTWTVSEKATGQIAFGSTSALGHYTEKETSFAFHNHSQPIIGLAPDTDCYYQLIGEDVAGQPYASPVYKVRTLPNQVPGPIPTPARPFAAPTITQTVNAPTSVPDDGSGDAGSVWRNWLATVAPNSIVKFRVGDFRLDRGFSLIDRKHLIFDLNGARFMGKGSPQLIASSPFVIDGGCSDIAIYNGVLDGNNPRTGTDIYDPMNENSNGISIYGNERIEIRDLVIQRTWADGVYTNEKGPVWPTDVWVHHTELQYNGRNVFTINSGRRVILELNHTDQTGAAVLDIEPDTNTNGVDGVTLRSNETGVWGKSSRFNMHYVACANLTAGPLAPLSNIAIIENHVSHGAPVSFETGDAGGLKMWIDKPKRIQGVKVINNRTERAGGDQQNGPDAVLRFTNIENLEYHGNVQPLKAGIVLAAVNNCAPIKTAP